jgi:DNA repair photolyase
VGKGIIGRRVLKGRGALSNPAGRFESEQVEAIDDGWFVAEQSASIATTVEPDRARGIISRNNSPDIPFEYSINPYRGCEHGCLYCLAGDTPILMADGTTRPLAQIRAGATIYGTTREGGYRKYVKTQVLAHWSVIKPAHRITLEDGTVLVAGQDHRFLTERGWKFVTGTDSGRTRPHLTTANKLMGVGAFAAAADKGVQYQRGYLCGLIRGDATIGQYLCSPPGGKWNVRNQSRPLPCDSEAVDRAQDWLSETSRESDGLAVDGAGQVCRPIQVIQTSTRAGEQRIRDLIAWPATATLSWRAGFVAGIFDAKGNYSRGALCLSDTDHEVIRWISDSLRAFSFKVVHEQVASEVTKPLSIVHVRGGLAEHLRFFHTFDPAVLGKRDISHQRVHSQARLRVVSIEPFGGATRLYDITTGTGDFIANGVVSHNCYARPSHAYMGLSAGIDFETRLFYKADAGKVLEEELAQPGYVCKPITVGANTDPYQPVERQMLVTRAVLEVLARTRHPVSIITKSALILRDLDILTDLAKDNLVSVAVSITSLSVETKRSLEPRTASPQARLRVMRELNAAGVPTGVMVAPVIPAITDHEMESILEAATDAGARWAGYVLIRLPYEVKDLFREWLTEHFPDRAAHVMSLIRDMRDGRDNDPRFGTRMRGTGPVAELLRNRFKIACRRLGLNSGSREIPQHTDLFRPPVRENSQLRLGF